MLSARALLAGVILLALQAERNLIVGTRADFYIGRGETAEWIGSIAFDGYPEGVDDAVLTAKNEADYRAAVKDFFATRDDATLPPRWLALAVE